MPQQKGPSAPPAAGSNRILRAGAIPEGILAALEAAGVRREGVLATAPVDLSADGRFAKRWLVVAPDRLAVVDLPAADGGSPQVAGQEPFKGLTALDYRAMVGGGVLLAKRGEAQRELLRCSRAADRAVQGVLGKLRVHLWPELPEDKDKKKEAKPADAAKPGEPARAAGGEPRSKSEGALLQGEQPVEKNKEKEKPPREAVPELTAETARIFLEQLDDLRVQLYCRKCGVPFKEDSQVCPLCINPGRTLLRVLKLARPYKKYLIGLAGIMVAGTLLSLVPPYIYKQLFDKALVPKNPELTSSHERTVFLFLCIGAWVGVELLSVALRVFRGRLSVLIGASVSRDLRGRTFSHLQLLSLGYFDRHKTGALMSRVSGDAQHLEGFLVDGVLWTMISVLQAVAVTCVLFVVNWKMALLVLLPAPLVILVTKLIWKRVMSRYRRLWEVISRLSAALNDSLRGVRVVKSFGREEQEIARFDRYNQASRTAMITAERTWTTLMPFIQFVMSFGGYLVWALGGYLIVDGRETPGTLVMFLGYTPMLYGPLGTLTQANQWLTRSMTAAERIFEILDTEPEVAEAGDAVAMPRIAGRIEFRNVTFGYEKHTPILKHATLDIAAGEMIGLVGASGAGKTTTVNLISRLYDVDQGQLLIDGVDVRKIRVADLRRQIGVVLQETYLFSGTVFENIAYAKPSAGREEVISAARLANAHGFIMDRPDGYDSEVEEGGNNFSGGEKQRLAIARAILHDPRILILDEATSSVDTKTEQEIQQAITRLTAGRTTFAIAHRLSTLRGASRLVVLEKGEIKDVGTHEELCAREGIYRDLVKAHAEMCSVVAVEG
jgi:ATP-binding cassette subfamily B protein